MAVMDEFKEQREAMKNGTFKQKISYFWCYYKWYVIISIAVVIFLVSFIHEIVTQKDDAFYGVFVNSWAQEGSEEYLQGFAEKLGIDQEKYEVSIDSSLYISPTSMDQTTIASSQKLMVYTAAAEIDVMVTDAATIEQYANNSTFADLREMLTPEEFARYEPYFYYIDQKVVEEKDAAQDALDENYTPNYPDPSKPEEMDEPIPVGIYVDSCTSFMERYTFLSEPVVLSIISNTQRPKAAVSFLDYLFDQE